jgi:DNA repair protein RAD51
MTAEEIEESQSGIDDGGMGGPGAPTPLSALEVYLSVTVVMDHDTDSSGL